MPFPDNSFDALVAVGCFHHTGNLQRCIDETFRVLKPGGAAYVMVYYKYSYRLWLRWPLRTLLSLFRRTNVASASQRFAYDSNLTGTAAPETVFASEKDVRQLFARFEGVRSATENWDDNEFSITLSWPIFWRWRGKSWRLGPSRERLLGTAASRFGLDLYIEARKPALRLQPQVV